MSDSEFKSHYQTVRIEFICKEYGIDRSLAPDKVELIAQKIKTERETIDRARRLSVDISSTLFGLTRPQMIYKIYEIKNEFELGNITKEAASKVFGNSYDKRSIDYLNAHLNELLYKLLDDETYKRYFSIIYGTREDQRKFWASNVGLSDEAEWTDIFKEHIVKSEEFCKKYNL